MKILYFTDKPSPYKVLFLNELSKTNEITTLYNEIEKDKRNKDWYKGNKPLYREICLKKYSYFQLKEILKLHYDAIIIANYATIEGAILIFLLQINKTPFYIHADGGIINIKDSPITKKIKTFFISKATYYLSSGNRTNEYLIHYGANPSNIFNYPFTSLLKEDILNNPVKYEDKMILRTNKGYNYKRLFVSVGSFIKRKGYDLFLEALSKCNIEKTGFLIIGGGEEKERYKFLIDKYNLKNVHLISFCSKREVFDYLKMSDIFFFPSREDIWGLVINEAMACGLPIISSNNVVSAVELIEKEYLYPPLNIEKQKKMIEYASKMTNDKLFSIGQNNLNIIKSYTIENMALKYNEILINNL